MLLQARAYGAPKSEEDAVPTVHTGVRLEPFDESYVPLVPYKVLEREYSQPQIDDIRVGESDRDYWMDLRPYCNTAPHTIQETTTVNVSKDFMAKCHTFD